MEFSKKLKLRLCLAGLYTALGIILTVIYASFKKHSAAHLRRGKLRSVSSEPEKFFTIRNPPGTPGGFATDKNYLFENWGARRAAFKPYFFLSFILGSLVKKPAAFNAALYVSSAFKSALATPCLIAPA